MIDSTQSIKKYYPEIDFIKAFAILSVVVLHILTFNGATTILYDTFASYHIWQAVPLFMLIFGFTFRLSIEKNHGLGKILSSRMIRLIIPLLVAYILSFVLIFIFNMQPVINWHIFIGHLPRGGMGNYFITLYIETIVYFTIFYYLVKHFNKYFVILASILFSIVGELIAYSIDISDSYMYASSVHRYTLLIALGYYFYDTINGEKNNFILIALGGVSALLLYIFSITHHPIWPYSEYNSAIGWGFQHFPYAFYTVILALILVEIYKKIENKVIYVTVMHTMIMTVSKSSFHIFLAQLFVFLVEKFYKIEMNMLYAVSTLFLSIFLGILWYQLETLILKYASLKVLDEK